jgi:hypothetical protein
LTFPVQGDGWLRACKNAPRLGAAASNWQAFSQNEVMKKMCLRGTFGDESKMHRRMHLNGRFEEMRKKTGVAGGIISCKKSKLFSRDCLRNHIIRASSTHALDAELFGR